jgi:aldehyde dehydrogenase (NAD+)
MVQAIAIRNVKLETKPNSDRQSSSLLGYRFGNLFFEGRWQPGSAGYSAEVRSPWTLEAIARINVANETDVDRAFKFAKLAQPAWEALPPGRKSEIFRNAARVLEARRTEVVDWLVREAGSTQIKAQIEWWAVHNSILEASTLPSHVDGRILYGDYPDRENLVYRLPVGVVSVISPWNWPLHLSMRSVAPALALGNAVVLKPAGDTPITGGLLIAKIFEEAGLPPGALSVIAGPSSNIGDPFVSHPIPRVLSFTGSTEVGRHAGELSLKSDMIKKTMLELGGNGPLIVTEDVDLEHAVHTAVVGKFLHQGQMCIAVNRIIVAEAIHDEFVARFVAKARALKVGGAADPDAAIGPIINREQFERITALVEGAKAEGARLLLAEPCKGLLMPPRVFDSVTQRMAIAKIEIFGPVATILRAKDDDEALRIANDTEYGLTSGVLCRDLGRAMSLARRIEAGMTHINDIPAVDMPQLAFGGDKNGGLGRFGSRDVTDEFTTQHWVSIQHSKAQYPF